MSDILIVGGGIIGMLTARELSLAGMQVTILEQGSIGRESSWAGGGIISPLYPWRYPDSVSALASWGQAFYPQLIEEINSETGLDAELIQSGLLILNTDEQKSALEWAKNWHANVQLVKNTEINNLDSGLSVDAVGNEDGLWMPDVNQVRNPRLVKTLRQYIEKLGVKVKEQCKVTDFIIKDSKVCGVKTSLGELVSDQLIVAGGAWTANLLEKINIEIDVKPVKGQMILFKTNPNEIKHIVLSQDRYIIPRRDGRILVGSTLEYTGFDKSITDKAQQDLFQEAIHLFPKLKNAEIEHHWAGLRPGSPDGVPYICEHSELKGLYINSGHFRNGVVLGPASARLMADIVLQRDHIINAKDYQF